MRELADDAKVRAFMRALGNEARGEGRVYFTGGASAVLIGWRASTIDIDLKLDPEPPGAFEAIATLKDRLSVNVELAAPDQFIPPLEGWVEQSRFIERHGAVDFFHYDFRAQALSKIERGHAQDITDVHQMLAHALVTGEQLRDAHARLEGQLIRYPAIDPPAFARKLAMFLEEP